jgi:hypothetical protein
MMLTGAVACLAFAALRARHAPFPDSPPRRVDQA